MIRRKSARSACTARETYVLLKTCCYAHIYVDMSLLARRLEDDRAAQRAAIGRGKGTESQSNPALAIHL